MARIFDVGVYAVAVIDAADTALQSAPPGELVLVDAITRDGKVFRELLVAHTARSLWRTFRCALKAGMPADAVFALGGSVHCRDITDIGIIGSKWATNLGNGGFVFYAPARRVVWSGWGELVRGLCRDLSLDGKASLRATEFALMIGDGLDSRTVHQWLAYSRISSQPFAEQFARLRECINAIHANWVLVDRHPLAWQFVRGNFPETKLPVLELLKTAEGAARVMGHIAATADPEFLRKNAVR